MATTHYCARCLTTFTEEAERCPNLSCGGKRPPRGWGVLLGTGDLLDRHYQIIKPLAVGGAGLTYLAREVGDDGEPMPPDLAIKVLYTQRDSGPFLRRLSNEAQILQELDHPNIVVCRGFVHRAGHAPYLVTQFEHGGSLSDHVERVGPLPAPVAASITRQILRALDVAHQRAVVHRDMKPENVLLAEPVEATKAPHIRLTDFGIAKVFGGVGNRLTKLGSFVGTPEFAAPEQFEGMSPSPATDLFAVGGVLYYLLVGEAPVSFTHRMDIESSYGELLDQIPPKLPKGLGEPMEMAILQEIIDHLMLPEPGDRWTAHQVIARLNNLIEGFVKPNPDTLELTAEGKAASKGVVRSDGTLDLDPGATFAWTGEMGPPEGEEAPPPPPTPQPPPPPEPTVAPPPPAPSPTLTPPAQPPVAVEGEGEGEDKGKGKGGLIAGALGTVILLGIVGVVVLGAGGVGLAWYLGAFSSGPPTTTTTTTTTTTPPPTTTTTTTTTPPPVELAAPVLLTGATDPDLVSERQALEAALQDQSDRLGGICELSGFAVITVTVEPDGHVRSVQTEAGYLEEAQTTCLAEALRVQSLPRTGEMPVKLRVPLTF